MAIFLATFCNSDYGITPWPCKWDDLFTVYNAAEDALAALETGNIWDAKRILIEAEQRAEELYIQSAEETVTC